MVELKSFPVATQDNPNSCWACASRMILAWFNMRNPSLPTYATDQLLADAYGVATKVLANKNIAIQRSASDVLARLGHVNNIDDHVIPTLNEIETEMIAQSPMLAMVGGTNPHGTPNRMFTGGHWVVIVGVDVATRKIKVFDPDTGNILPITYNDKTYSSSQYWQTTSYIS